jgi:hypothetical protein
MRCGWGASLHDPPRVPLASESGSLVQLAVAKSSCASARIGGQGE